MKNKNAFTLVEMLSVVVILGITFMFILPSLTELFTMGNKTETELIEERVLSAAKEYVNKIDGSFYTKLYKEGDTNYIYKSDLIKAGLITEEEVSKLNTFAGVKGEVIKNDRIRYTVEYINASNNDYTNEELYLMMQNMNKNYENILEKIDNIDKGKNDTTEIDALKTKVDKLTNKDNIDNIFLKNYPVGSIYMSENSTSPEELFGGEWESYGSGRTLVGVDSTQTEFASVGLVGGEKTHTLTTNEIPKHRHSKTKIVAGYSGWSSQTWGFGTYGYVYDIGSFANQNASNYNGPSVEGQDGYTGYIGNSQPHNNLQPYITVYMWKRIS